MSNIAPALPRRDYSRSPGLVRLLKTVVYVVSLSLGVGSVFAAIWSRYLLPLLYSSFSARKAVTERQLVEMTTLVQGLRTIRSFSLYQQPIRSDSTSEDTGPIETQSLALTEPIHPTSCTLHRLPNLLSALSTHMSATESTRSSLIATVESFTSYLHTQSFLFARGNRGAGNGYLGSVGMNALDDSLRRAGAGGTSINQYKMDGQDVKESEDEESPRGEANLIDLGVKTQDWEDCKREIRAMKGMLLSRRSLTAA